MLVGFSLGLTGGGGAVFAVPLLVYGLAVDPRAAVSISLATVGATALAGFIQRARHGLVEFPTGLVFAAAGMLTAPVGVWLSRRVPETALLLGLGALMLVIAVRTWFRALERDLPPECGPLSEGAGPACRLGLAIGVLTGLFGVGGGFLIVPALVGFGGLDMQRAIGTSLFVTTLISLAGISSHLVGGGFTTSQIGAFFLLGSLAGMWVGTAVSGYLAGRRLQQVFAAAVAAVGVFMIARSLERFSL
jgi:uncharacterized membrane protein YfcA